MSSGAQGRAEDTGLRGGYRVSDTEALAERGNSDAFYLTLCKTRRLKAAGLQEGERGPTPSPLLLSLGSLGLALPPGAPSGWNHLLGQRPPFFPNNSLLQVSLESSEEALPGTQPSRYSSSHFGHRAPPGGGDGSLAQGLRPRYFGKAPNWG